MRLNLLERPQPAFGILLACAGWALSHQAGSNSAFDACVLGGEVTVIVSVIGLLITAAGGLYGLMSHRVVEGSGRKLLAFVAMLLSVLAGFAIVLQIAAGLILPECAA